MKHLMWFTFLFPIFALAENPGPQTTLQPGVPVTSQTIPGRQAVRAYNDGIVSEPSWWHARRYQYEIGYEAAATNTTGVLGTSVISFGTWFNEGSGIDFFLGFTKGANANAESISETTNELATPKTKSATTTFSGTNAPFTLTVAANPKMRVYQTDWFQINVGLMAGIFIPASATYQTGTKTETYADATDPTNKTVSEVSYGTITARNKLSLGIGPRISTQFYIKWFPHLAVGFATGIFTFLGGDSETTTDTTTRAYTVVNGVEQAPSSKSTNHAVVTTRPGLRATTFGLGGTTFNFTGTFTLRYVW
jgi:hypothetical protein